MGEGNHDRKNVMLFVVGGLLVVLGLAFFVSPYASSSPDGLEKVSQEQGFSSSAKDSATSDGALADYGVAGVSNDRVSTGLAGVVGVAITFGLGMIVFGLIRRQRSHRHPEGTVTSPG
jgi:cobalt/nickel transport protein